MLRERVVPENLWQGHIPTVSGTFQPCLRHLQNTDLKSFSLFKQFIAWGVRGSREGRTWKCRTKVTALETSSMCFCWFWQFIGKSNEVDKVEVVRVCWDIGKMLLTLHIYVIPTKKKNSTITCLMIKYKHYLIQVAMLSGAILFPVQTSNKPHHLKFYWKM